MNYTATFAMSAIFPREIIVHLISNSRVLRVFRQTCREYSAMVAWLDGPRWAVTIVPTYITVPHRTWLNICRPINRCYMSEESPQITSVTIYAGTGRDCPVSTWYQVYAGTLAGIYSACLAREYLLVGANPVIPYRTYRHWLPLEDFYIPTGIKITQEPYENTCALTINPADFNLDYVDSLFTYTGPMDEYDVPAGAVYAEVLITLHAPASAVYEYFAGHPLRV